MTIRGLGKKKLKTLEKELEKLKQELKDWAEVNKKGVVGTTNHVLPLKIAEHIGQYEEQIKKLKAKKGGVIHAPPGTDKKYQTFLDDAEDEEIAQEKAALAALKAKNDPEAAAAAAAALAAAARKAKLLTTTRAERLEEAAAAAARKAKLSTTTRAERLEEAAAKRIPAVARGPGASAVLVIKRLKQRDEEDAKAEQGGTRRRRHRRTGRTRRHR